MNKLLLIYGVIIPFIVITSIMYNQVLMAWWVLASIVAIFHNTIFNETTGAKQYE